MRIAPTVDMSTYALQTLVNLMLAQAQECVWQKAVMDQLRDGTIARLSLQISDYYDTAFELASNSSIQTVFPKYWLTHMQIKVLHFHAASQFRKACECISQDKYGEEVSRLQVASDSVRRAIDISASGFAKLPSSIAVMNDLRSLQQIITTNLARAEKDNDIIYLAPVPPPSVLPTIAKISMVKATPPKEISDPTLEYDNPVIGTPLFQKLVPFAVHQAASIYVDRKEKIIQEDIIAKLNELNRIYTR